MSAAGCQCTTYYQRHGGKLVPAVDCVCPDTHIMNGETPKDFERRRLDASTTKEKTKMTTARTDATNEDMKAIDDLRAKRDEQARDAWKPVTRLDARAGGVKAMRNDLRLRLGQPDITKLDVREMIAARGGDPAIVPGAGAFQLLQIVRANRSERERGAEINAAAMPETSGGETRTDASDLPDLDALRKQRDEQTANAWKAPT